MGQHERAWNGLQICVFGATPLVPMQIEQAFSSATPANEYKVESFEDYSQAYDFCRHSRDVGLIILLENCGKLPPQQVFRELAKHYEVRGLPCFGVLLHEKFETITGLKVMLENENFLDYISVNAFSDAATSAQTVNKIWKQFTASFEKKLIPESIQEVLNDVASQEVGKESVAFYDRATTMLMSNLNVSWVELVAVRWQLVLNQVNKKCPYILNSQNGLLSVTNIAVPDSPDLKLSLLEILKSKIAIAKRVTLAGLKLDELRRSGHLMSALSEISLHAKPGAPSLLRHLASNSHQIEEMARGSTQMKKAI